VRRLILCVAALATLAACSNGGAPNAANNAAQSNAAPAAPSAPAVATVSGTFTVDGKPATMAFVGAYKVDPIDGKPVIAIVMSTLSQAGSANPPAEAITEKFGTEVIVLDINPDGTFVEASVYNKNLKSHVVTMDGGISVKNFTSTGGVISGELTTNGPTDSFGQKLNIDLTFKVTAP
jgi:hypothetical protein